jgi:predicted O-methyltransferase YrrM
MQSWSVCLAVACVGSAVCGLAWAYSAGPDEQVRQAREELVQKFRRTPLNTTPGDAMMLRILVESSGAKRGVEIGSASGFGAINMGIAFERTGGQLITLEIDPQMAATCRANLEKAGLQQTVTCLEGDALTTLPSLEGEFDFVFLDAAKQDYLKYLKLIETRLKPGAVVVADNVIQSAHAMQDFLDYVQSSPDYDTVVIRASMEKNDGMAISYKIR